MAKAKTKKIVMDTTATEVKPGVWEFTVGVRLWQWHAGMGLNTSITRLDDPERNWTDVLYCKTIDHACMFAWGYDSGHKVAADK